MTEQTDPIDGIDLPRFTRRIGVLAGADSPPDAGTTALGVLEPFEGVLGPTVARPDRPAPPLDYLVLAWPVAGGARGRNRDGGRRRAGRGSSGSPDPSGPDGAPPATDGETELKVYQLLRSDADRERPGRTGSGAGGADGDETRSGPSGHDAGGGPGGAAVRGTDDDPDGNADGIRELRRTASGHTVLGGERGAVPGLSRLSDAPRTVLATAPVPTRAADPGAATGRRPPGTAGDPARTDDAGVGASGGDPRPSGTPPSFPGAGTGSVDPDPADVGTEFPRFDPVLPDADADATGSRPGTPDAGATASPADATAPPTAGSGAADAPALGRPGADVSLTVVERDRPRPDDAGPSGGTPDSGRDRSPTGIGPAGAAGGRGIDSDGDAGSGAQSRTTPGDRPGAGDVRLPDYLSLEGGGPDSRFIDELYRALRKKARIERERRGG